MKFETLVARGGRDVPSASRPLTAPIYQTNVYVFEDMETVESVWEGKAPGFVYGRYGTGNHAMLEELVAGLEGAEAGVACASGMGATTALLLGLFEAGDHLVSARDLYGSTAAFLAARRRAARRGDGVRRRDRPRGDPRRTAADHARGVRRGDLEPACSASSTCPRSRPSSRAAGSS